MSGIDITWLDVASTRKKDAGGTPLVTIFGAGISGLSAAHELIERGFAVQVVETVRDPDDEHHCRVGGLAASQIAHAPATVQRAHPYMFDENPSGEDSEDPSVRSGWTFVRQAGAEKIILYIDNDESGVIDTDQLSMAEIAAKLASAALALGYDATVVSNDVEIRNKDPRRAPLVSVLQEDGNPSVQVKYESLAPLRDMRDLRLHPTLRRIPTPSRLQMDWSADAGSWENLTDAHGVLNKDKMDFLFDRLVEAHEAFEDDRLARAESAGVGHNPTSPRNDIREGLVVEIRAHAYGLDKSEKDNLDQSKTWASWVQQGLESRNGGMSPKIPDLDKRLIRVKVGQREPVGNHALPSGRRLNDRVEIRIVESLIPGEHGYRFFPRFYRHLFDTMKRTPILDEKGRETGDTAYDQLVPTPTVDVALTGGGKPEEIPVRAVHSLDELRKLLKIHLQERKADLDRKYKENNPGQRRPSKDGGLALQETDLLRFQLAILKYLTSSKARREKTYEEKTWFDFMLGDWDPEGSLPPPYSQAMIDVINDTPQALVAMDAKETDARTQGTIYCQLLLDGLTGGDDSNRTLNGPTTEAWLHHWKTYLRRQGVRFFTGKLKKLIWVERCHMEGGNQVCEYELVPEVDMAPDVTSTGSVGVIFADGTELKLVVNGETLTTDAATILDATRNLALKINLENLGADTTVRVIEHPKPAGLEKHTLGTIRVRAHGRSLRVDTLPPLPSSNLSVVINGVGIDEPDHDLVGLRDALLENIRDAVGRVAARPRGIDEIVLDSLPASEIVSVAADLEPRYQVRIRDVPDSGGALKDIEVSHERAPRDTATDVRDSLREKLVHVFQTGGSPVSAEDFGATGIEIKQTRASSLRLRIDVVGCRLGPLITFDQAWAGILSEGAPPAPQLRAESPQLTVMGAEPEVSDEEYVAHHMTAKGQLGASPGGGPDFYVMAIPFEDCSTLVWQAWYDKPASGTEGQIDPMTGLFRGCFGELQRFDIETKRREAATPHNAIDLVRDAHGRPTPPEYPLRDLSGIQYFFQNQVRIGRGHTYFADARWGLSSISQLTYWRKHMSDATSAFLGQLSVVIGNWYRPYGTEGRRVPSAWRSTRREIASRTWDQVLDGIEDIERTSLVPPTYYHLDQAIGFSGGTDSLSGSGILLKPIDPNGNPTELTVQGELLNTSQTGSAAAIVDDLVQTVANDPNTYPCLAAAHQESAQSVALFLTPVAIARPEDGRAARLAVRVIKSKSNQAATYTIRINGVDVAHVEPAPDADPGSIRDALVHEVNQKVPGVTAVGPTETDLQKRIIRLRSGAEMTVAAVAVNAENQLLMEPNPPRLLEFTGLLNLSLEDGETPVHNTTPFLINGPKVWKHRPGLRVPKPVSAPQGHIHAQPTQGERRVIDYELTAKRWLMAGNHMATHTRMTTMESANESARHAVVAILHALLHPAEKGEPPTYNGQGKLFGSMPRIFDPEEHELGDAMPLKRLDQQLVAADCDHFLDILRVGEMIDQIPDVEALPLDAKPLVDLINKAGGGVTSDWSFTEVDELQRSVQSALAALVGIEAPE